MLIRVSSGIGSGPTRLSAFDQALQEAGVADFNLVRLSSIIPPGADVAEVSGADQIAGRTGDRVYCVYASSFASTPNEEAWAGLSWALSADHAESGGLFVEHAGSSEITVRRDLEATLAMLMESRSAAYETSGTLVRTASCVGHPVCAVVVATYGTAGWETD